MFSNPHLYTTENGPLCNLGEEIDWNKLEIGQNKTTGKTYLKFSNLSRAALRGLLGDSDELDLVLCENLRFRDLERDLDLDLDREQDFDLDLADLRRIRALSGDLEPRDFVRSLPLGELFKTELPLL